ncbi:hypothetical protein AB0I16_05995 [Streptomyces sp. NPDC050703]|uniref:hypothetical protein n=1 Tax=Streptomyces sp. NPDC050703 TaxID=3157218 RepID=UPI00342246C6
MPRGPRVALGFPAHSSTAPSLAADDPGERVAHFSTFKWLEELSSHRESHVNRRYIRPVAVSLTAAAALLLTACGGDGGGSDNDKIAGADEAGAGKSASPAGGKSKTPDAIDRPRMTFPSDVDLVFADAQVSDPDQAAALGDAQNFVRAIRYGIVEQDVNDAAYKFYSEFKSQAQTYAKDQIEQRVDKGLTISGKMRFSRIKVTPAENKESTVVSFCADSTKLYSKEVKTEKVHHTEPSLSDYYSWQVLMKPSKNAEGLWRAQKVQVKEKAQECR